MSLRNRGFRVAFVLSSVCALASLSRAEQPFTISVSAPPAKKATPAKVTVHIAPAAGYHMNKEYPTTAKITPPTGVAVEKTLVKVEETGATFEIPYTASEPGKKVLAGDLRFAVCTATTCDPKREALSITVEVK